jgi:hypothetical protein
VTSSFLDLNVDPMTAILADDFCVSLQFFQVNFRNSALNLGTSTTSYLLIRHSFVILRLDVYVTYVLRFYGVEHSVKT